MSIFFFDFEKAYDTTWNYGLMRDSHDVDLRGRLPLFVLKTFYPKGDFVSEWGSTSLCDFYNQEMVLQGSISSVTRFIVKINSITSCIRNGVDKSLFVDGFGVSYCYKHMQTCKCELPPRFLRSFVVCINRVVYLGRGVTVAIVSL